MSGILKAKEYILDYEVGDDKNLPQQLLTLKLKYIGGEPVMTHLKRVSKPGLRKYMNYKEIPKVLSGKGIAIFSTPKGVLAGDEARKSRVGGEYLCEIW
jgi:small subunit ribosomal protein S8